MNDQMTGQLVYVSSGAPPFKQQPQNSKPDLDEQLASQKSDRRSRGTFRSLERYRSCANLSEMTYRGIDRLPVAGNLAYPPREASEEYRQGW